jgi:hypothetical protein
MFSSLMGCYKAEAVDAGMSELNVGFENLGFEGKVGRRTSSKESTASTAASSDMPSYDFSDDSSQDDLLRLTLADVQSAVAVWVRTAASRDVDAMVELYDPAIGRLLGTVDTAEDVHRSNPSAIREYFKHFLGGHQAVEPSFPRFDAKDVIFLSMDTSIYSGSAR